MTKDETYTVRVGDRLRVVAGPATGRVGTVHALRNSYGEGISFDLADARGRIFAWAHGASVAFDQSWPPTRDLV